MADKNTKQPPRVTETKALEILHNNIPNFKRIGADSGTANLVQAQREAKFFFDRVMASRDLQACTFDSLESAFLSIAGVGLSLNPVMQHAAILPIWNKKLEKYEAAFWPQYRGYIKLATDTGLVSAIEVENVYKMDDFQHEKKDGQTAYTHRINIDEPRNTEANYYRGTYVIAHLRQPPPPFLFEWVPAEDINKMRDNSDNYDPNKPWCVWVKWEDEMRRKSAIKRAQKFWPKSDGQTAERFARAMYLDNMLESGNNEEAQREPVETSALPALPAPVTSAQAQELNDLAIKSKIDPKRICSAYFVDNLAAIEGRLFNEVRERIIDAGKKAAAKSAKKTAPQKEEKK